MPRGGKRVAGEGKRIGRPKTTPLPKVRRDVALEILDVINGGLERAKCSPEAERWLKLLDTAGNRLSFDMLRYIKECADGKPKQRTDPLAFDPNAPLRVVVEHIGRRSPIPITA